MGVVLLWAVRGGMWWGTGSETWASGRILSLLLGYSFRVPGIPSNAARTGMLKGHGGGKRAGDWEGGRPVQNAWLSTHKDPS